MSFAELSDDIFENLPDDTAQTALKTRLELTGHQSVVGSRLIELSLYVICIRNHHFHFHFEYPPMYLGEKREVKREKREV